MATKVIVIGENVREKKPIEFVTAWIGKNTIELAGAQPNSYKNIELISQDYFEGFDLMFAYDSNRSDGTVFLGHFNDGVV